MNHIINLYSCLQILGRLSNNYYKNLILPTLLQFGMIIVCIPSAVCIGRWKVISKDPRLALIIIAIINGLMIIFVGTTCASNLFKSSTTLLQNMRRVKYQSNVSLYLRKRIISKQMIAVRIANCLIDSEMPLNVALFCVSNIISLLMIFKNSKDN